MSLHLPRLSLNTAIVDGNGRPTTTFLRYFNDVLSAIEAASGAVAGQNDAISDAHTVAATAATDAANAVTSAAAQAGSLALALSYTTPTDLLTYGYDPNTGARSISVASHARQYGDGTSVAVAAGTIANVQPATLYFVTYADPARAGGSVTFTASTNAAVIAQVQGRHLVGSITTGAL